MCWLLTSIRWSSTTPPLRKGIADNQACVYDILAEAFESSELPPAILGPAIFRNDEDVGKFLWKRLTTPWAVELLEQYVTCNFQDVEITDDWMPDLGALSLWDMELYVKRKEL